MAYPGGNTGSMQPQNNQPPMQQMQPVQVIMVPAGTNMQYVQQPYQMQQPMQTTQNYPTDGQTTAVTGNNNNNGIENYEPSVDIPESQIKRNKAWARGTLLRGSGYKPFLFFVFLHHILWLCYGINMKERFIGFLFTIVIPAITISMALVYQGWSFGAGGFKKAIESNMFPIIIPIGILIGIACRAGFWFSEKQYFCNGTNDQCRLAIWGYMIFEIGILLLILIDSLLLHYMFNIKAIFGDYFIRVASIMFVFLIAGILNIVYYNSDHCTHHFPATGDILSLNEDEHCQNFRGAYILFTVWMLVGIIVECVLKVIGKADMLRKTVFVIHIILYCVWAYFMFFVDIAGQWFGYDHWWYTFLTNLYIFTQVISLIAFMRHSHWKCAVEQTWDD